MNLPKVLLNQAKPLSSFSFNGVRNFHIGSALQEIRKEARLRVVDNSAIGMSAMKEGKPPRCIHVYSRKRVGYVGDRILVAVKGEKKQAILLGCHQIQKPMVPKFDSNNIVLIEPDGTPIGNRILTPIPTLLRSKLKSMSRSKGPDYTKILAIATRFV